MRDIGEHAVRGPTWRQGAGLNGLTIHPIVRSTSARPIEVGLVTMMPDAALAKTELQFARLFGAAVGERTVLWRKYALPGVPRGPVALAYLQDSYERLEDLWAKPPDAIVITGAEPKTPDVRDEPYWPELAKLFDRADRLGMPMLLSCLSAHAAVLHFSGIRRRPLDTKCFGIFDHVRASDNDLTTGLPARMRVVHSRWNEVDEADLLHAGYEVLIRSPKAGVGVFGRDAILFCQAHPEYDVGALLGEYRRDVGRYLSGSQQTYPTEPAGYFGAAAQDEIVRFRLAVERTRSLTLQSFPYERLRTGLDDSWEFSASPIIKGWLARVGESQKAACVA